MLKFNHAFLGMMTASLAAALFLPARASEPVRTAVSVVFSPVSAPVHRGSAWLGERIVLPTTRPDPTGPRTFDELDSENANLRVEIMSLAKQLEELKLLNADRAAMGPIRERSVPARVTGHDSGNRQMLVVVAPSGSVLEEGMPVITTRAYVGRLTAGVRNGARVLLSTDVESKVQCAFARFTRDDTGELKPEWIQQEPPPLVIGTGPNSAIPGGGEGFGGGMRVSNLSLRQVEQLGVKVGDWLVINDRDFVPRYASLLGYRVGRVAEIRTSRTNLLMADIVVEPPVDFRRLREIMVVNR